MKVSNILTLIAALAGVMAVYYAYQNWEAYAGDPLDDEARTVDAVIFTDRTPLLIARELRQNILSDRRQTLADEEQLRDETFQERESLRADIEELDAVITQLNQERGEKESLRNSTRDQIAEAERQITQLKTELQATGTVQELKESVETRIARRNEVLQQLALEQERLAAAQARQRDVEGSLSHIREIERRQQSGEMSAEFTTTVREVYGRWGFVVINAGANQGVNARSILEVRRGNQIIASMLVSTLEPNVAICAILDDSAGTIGRIQPGDLVVVSSRSYPSPEPDPTEAGDMPEDMPEEDDGGLFGGGAAWPEDEEEEEFMEIEVDPEPSPDAAPGEAPAIDPANPFEF